MLAVGLTVQISIQAVLNIAVVPYCTNTGISLPFFSYGGTALTNAACPNGSNTEYMRLSLVED